MTESWIFRLGPVPGSPAAVNLFCLPFAGGTAAAFRKWPPRLRPEVAVLPVQLPGRGLRLRELPRTRLTLVARELAEAIEPLARGRYAFFGYSLGALIAFELTREMRRRGAPAPVHLFVCARRAPHLGQKEAPIHLLPDAPFIDQVRRRYDAIPAEVADEPDLMRLLLPALRADFEMLETYVYSTDEPLDCPITAVGGKDDERATLDELEAWGLETRDRFSVRQFPGGHFFVGDGEDSVVRLVKDELHQAVSAASRP